MFLSSKLRNEIAPTSPVWRFFHSGPDDSTLCRLKETLKHRSCDSDIKSERGSVVSLPLVSDQVLPDKYVAGRQYRPAGPVVFNFHGLAPLSLRRFEELTSDKTQ